MSTSKPCEKCGVPVWSYETGSVYGGTITYGCPKCGVADRDTWRARAEKAEADLRDANEWRDKLADKIIELEAATSRGRELVDDANERAAQAEAQVAEMLEGASKWRERPCPRGGRAPCACCGEASDHMPDDECVVGGRTLLAELEALRELERVTRARVQNAVPEWAPEIRSVLAAVDAARKGE